MKTYIPPVNPLHENPYSPEDLWWLDDAWNEATLRFFVRIADEIDSYDDGTNSDFTRVRTPGLETARRLSAALELNLKSNLPGMIPSGDWLAEFLLSLDGFLDDPDSFRSWEEHSHLSKAARLYTYIQSLRLKGGDDTPWAGSDIVSDLLLKFPDFTEADLQFLVVDGGSSLGIASREVALTNPSTHLLTFSALLGSAYENGAVTGPRFKALLANHSFAKSPLFPKIVDFIAEERNNPILREHRIYDEQAMLQAAALNPATPTAVLESLVKHFHPELTWVLRWDKRSRVVPEGRFSWPDEAIFEAEKAVNRRSFDELSSIDAGEVREFFHNISFHPNWVDGDEHATLPIVRNTYNSGPTDWAVERPTVSDQGESYVRALVSRTNKVMSQIRGRLLKGAAYSTPKEPILKDVAEDLARAVLLGEPVNYVDLCQVGFAIGSLVGAYQDLSDQLGEAGEAVPVEWLIELSS